MIPGSGRSTGEGIGYPLQPSLGFPCGSAGKESACNVGDLGLISKLGRSPGEGKGYPLQYSGLEKSMDCIVHGVAKSQTRLSDFHFHFPQEPGAARWRSSQKRAQQKLEEKLPPPLQCILLTKINTVPPVRNVYKKV